MVGSAALRPPQPYINTLHSMHLIQSNHNESLSLSPSPAATTTTMPVPAIQSLACSQLVILHQLLLHQMTRTTNSFVASPFGVCFPSPSLGPFLHFCLVFLPFLFAQPRPIGCLERCGYHVNNCVSVPDFVHDTTPIVTNKAGPKPEMRPLAVPCVRRTGYQSLSSKRTKTKTHWTGWDDRLSACWFACLYNHPRPSVHPLDCQYVRLYVSLSVYQSVCLSISQSVCLMTESTISARTHKNTTPQHDRFRRAATTTTTAHTYKNHRLTASPKRSHHVEQSHLIKTFLVSTACSSRFRKDPRGNECCHDRRSTERSRGVRIRGGITNSHGRRR